MEILSGINSSPVRRLKKTWEVCIFFYLFQYFINLILFIVLPKKELPNAAKTKLQYLESVMSHEGSYREYRTILHNCDPPTIPYLGTYLTDLTFIEDGNPDMDGHLINFDKRYKVAAVIGEIQQYQKIGYDFVPYSQVQYWLTKLESVDEEEAYSISLKVEPRNTEEAVETLLRDEEKLRAEIKALQLRNADLEVFSFFLFYYFK